MQSESDKGRILQYLNCINNSTVRKEIVSCLKDSTNAQALYLVSIAPALISFVNHVLTDAESKGKDRLYFLSRDGYQMFLIAKRLTELSQISIDCRYLNVSRFSMRLPGYHRDIDAAIDSICVGGINVTPERILKRTGATKEECDAILAEIGITDEKDKILNYRQVIEFKDKIAESQLLRECINIHSKAAYDDAIAYLIQEGLTRDNNYAIVDSGWVGTLQCSIERLVKSVDADISVDGYYFGMFEYPLGANKDAFHPYYFGPTFGLREKSTFSNSLFESIVSSTEGMTVGYQTVANTTYPIKKGQTNPNVDILLDNEDVLKRLLSHMKSAEPWESIDKKTIKKLFMLFMARPTEMEVSAYGDVKFSDDVLDGEYQSVAAELSYRQIKDQWFFNKLLIISGIRKKAIYESAWLEGSAVRCGKRIKNNLRHIRRYKRFVYARKQIHGKV